MRLKEKLLLRIAKRWIAGESREDALRATFEANKLGYGVILNYLGEEFQNLRDVDDAVREYLELQEVIQSGSHKACISPKPTQLGLAIGPEHYLQRIERIIEAASDKRQLVWIDMESSNYVQSTITTYAGLLERFQNVGLAIQANLHRTYQDVLDLLPLKPKFRLVKGAYKEPNHIAYTSRRAVTENFERIMRLLFEKNAQFAVATHDEKLVNLAIELYRKSSAKVEFQMLRGIRSHLKSKLKEQGFEVWEYIPYGPRWYNYSKRRIREHPENIWLLLRSLIGG